MTDPTVHLLGTACRLPGGLDSLDDLVVALDDPQDAITGPPPWRGFDAFRGDGPGRSYQLDGGWLQHDLRRFDPTLFGLNPREARDLDPQQRLLLTCTREALDDAQVRPDQLGRVGVYVGISGSEYKVLAQRRGPDHISPYIGTGTHPSTAAGRLAYTFDLAGPAVAIDTACSSGLVALHHGLQALRSGAVDAAVVGAVNVLLDPEAHVSMASMGTLSRRGACHSYSAHADGYVRSEGCVVLVLRRGGEVGLAKLHGSACNQDGRSSGLTAPRASAQVDVLRGALEQAEIAPETVAFHEGHGSATPLGDRVELTALGEVYGGRQGLPLGSVKARLGHLEAAAGLAGVLHALAIVGRGEAPAMPHADPPTPALTGSPMAVPHEAVALAGRVATVSAFGIGGTNAAVVLEANEVPSVEGGEEAWLCLSGTDETALATQRERVVARLQNQPFGPLARASQRGLHGEVRQAIWAGPDTWRARLEGAEVFEARRSVPLLAFPGQGVARPGLGRSLVEAFPLAREVFDEVCAAADPWLGHSLADRLWKDGDALLTDMPAMQVGVFAVGVAYARWLRQQGVVWEGVIGHSSGEWAAAVAADMVSVADAVRVLVRRGQLLEEAGPGAMWAVFAPEAEVRRRLVDGVGVAAVNHAGETVISGPPDGCVAVAAALAEAGFDARQLSVSIAGHSEMLEPLLPKLREVVADVALRAPSCTFVSTALADIDHDAVVRPEYWVRQFRDPVLLASAFEVAHDEGLGPVVEAGPHPRMASAGRVAGVRGACLGHKDATPETTARQALARLWAMGVALPEGPRSPAAKPAAVHQPRELWLEGVQQVAPCWTLGWRPVSGGAVVEAEVVPDGTLEELITWAQGVLGGWLEEGDGPRVLQLNPDVGSHAALAGWLRSVRWERPGWRLGLVWAAPGDDLPAVPSGEELRRIDGVWQGRRLLPLGHDAAPDLGGHWVITGGFGALGLRTARWLVDHGASGLTLVGRRGCPDTAREAVDALAARVPVVEEALDIAEAVPISLERDDLGGVVHAAGVVRDAAFFTSTAEDRAVVFAPKVAGTDRLVAALAERPDVWMIGFSSLTGAVGGEGQSAYGAANAHLDEALRRRHQAGGRAVSIGWGPWAGEGLAAATLDRRDAQGLPPMDPQAAVGALGTALSAGVPWVGVVGVAPDVMGAALRGHHQPVWSEVVEVRDELMVQADEVADHVVAGAAWLSAADQLCAALARHPALVDVRFVAPIAVPVEGLTLTWGPEGLRDGVHDVLRYREGPAPEMPQAPEPVAGEAVDLDALYASFRERGVEHGPAYRRTVEARRDGDRVWVRAEGGSPGQRLDGLLSTAAVWAEGDKALVPAEVKAAWAGNLSSVAQVVITRTSHDELVVDVVGSDAGGEVVLILEGMRWAAVQATQGVAAPSRFTGLDAEGRRAAVLEVVLRTCEDVLRTPGIVPDRDLMEQGLDSILALELRDRLAGEGLDVPLHRVVGGASPNDLVTAAEEGLGPVEQVVPVAAPVVAEAERPRWEAWAPAFFLGVLVGATVWAMLG